MNPHMGHKAVTLEIAAEPIENPSYAKKTTDIIWGKQSLHYFLSYIRFIAQICALPLLIHKEKIQIYIEKPAFFKVRRKPLPWKMMCY